jgi:DNA-binding beta-propeller fold protein YncE
VAFDSHDRLHLMEAGKGQVYRVDRRTGSLTLLMDVDGPLDNIALDEEDHLYATSLGDAQVLTLERGGRVRALTRGGFFAPGGVAVDSAGLVWVADLFSVRRVRHGWPRPLSSFYALYGIEDSVDRALTMAVEDGELLLTTLNNGGVVQRVDAGSGAVRSAELDFYGPTNALYHDGDIAVAQLFSGDVVRASDRSPLIEGLSVPLGLASSGGTLYVSDWATGTIWSASDAAAPSVVANGLREPKGLAVLGEWLFVVEVGADRVAAIHLPTRAVSTLFALDLGDPLPKVGAPPYGLFTGIAVDASRQRLYVASDRTNQVLVYQLVMPRQRR